MARVYVESELGDGGGAEVDIVLREIAAQYGVDALRKAVLLVWFDAEETPTPTQLDRIGADFWDVS